MSGIPSATPDWTSILASTIGGGIVGFLSSLLLEPAKKRFLKPKIEFDFPINHKSDIQDSLTTPYISLMSTLTDPNEKIAGRKEHITIRLLIKNTSKTFTAEGCRVFLTKIDEKRSGNDVWKSKHYLKNNQIA